MSSWNYESVASSPLTLVFAVHFVNLYQYKIVKLTMCETINCKNTIASVPGFS
jgi:hypothetical protein